MFSRNKDWLPDEDRRHLTTFEYGNHQLQDKRRPIIKHRAFWLQAPCGFFVFLSVGSWLLGREITLIYHWKQHFSGLLIRAKNRDLALPFRVSYAELSIVARQMQGSILINGDTVRIAIKSWLKEVIQENSMTILQRKKWRTKEHSHKKPSVITVLFKNKELLPDCTNVEEYDVRHRISWHLRLFPPIM